MAGNSRLPVSIQIRFNQDVRGILVQAFKEIIKL
jgi:hypothetical protein